MKKLSFTSWVNKYFKEYPCKFNAYLNGEGYWSRFGALDEAADRYPMRFGPAEVSLENPQGRMDVTALLTNQSYGATPGKRHRRFAAQGILIRKWETYDKRYDDWSSYEWAVGTGAHGLT